MNYSVESYEFNMAGSRGAQGMRLQRQSGQMEGCLHGTLSRKLSSKKFKGIIYFVHLIPKKMLEILTGKNIAGKIKSKNYKYF